MDCACVYVGDWEAFDDGGESLQVAGIERRCCECAREIALGERYERAWGGYFDDDENLRDVHNYETCIDCTSIRRSFFCDGWVYEFVWEFLEEHLAEVVGYHGGGVSSDCLISLTPHARAKVCDLIESIWDSYE